MALLEKKTRDLSDEGSLRKRIVILRSIVALLMLSALSAHAENCSDYPGGVLDGFAGTVAPSQLKIDRN